MNWLLILKGVYRYWPVLLAVGGVGVGGVWVKNRSERQARERQELVDSMYARGHTDAQAEAALRVQMLLSVTSTLKRTKDSVVRVARDLEHRTTSRVETLKVYVAAVPPAVRDSYPTVDRALTEAGLLAADVERLTAVRVVERQVFDSLIQKSDSLLQDQVQAGMRQVVETAKLEKRIVVLEQRPRWRTVVRWTVTGVGAGLLAGKYIFGGGS